MMEPRNLIEAGANFVLRLPLPSWANEALADGKVRRAGSIMGGPGIGHVILFEVVA